MDSFQATWEQGTVAYRRSAVGHHDPHRLATWLRAAERTCTLGDFPVYDREKLEAALPELRSLTVEDPVQAVQRAQALLRNCGVALTLVPAVPGLGTHGATRWIQGHTLIQLSDLWTCDDQLWFTLFHEIAHVLLHESNGLYLNKAPQRAYPTLRADHPGSLAHVDVKKLGNIPDSGEWRFVGRA